MAIEGSCTLYVNSVMSMSALLEFVKITTNTAAKLDSFDCDWSIIDIRKNEEYSPKKQNSDDGFLFYKYIIDVEPHSEAAPLEPYMKQLRDFVSALKAADAKVVSDYDELNS